MKFKTKKLQQVMSIVLKGLQESYESNEELIKDFEKMKKPIEIYPDKIMKAINPCFQLFKAINTKLVANIEKVFNLIYIDILEGNNLHDIEGVIVNVTEDGIHTSWMRKINSARTTGEQQ